MKRLLLLLALAPRLLADDARDQRWRDDLAFLRAELPKVHKDLFHAMTREQFERDLAMVGQQVPLLADHEIAARIARIVANAGDGHTHLDFSQPALGFHMLPVRFHQFSDGLFIRDAADPALVGAKVVRIGELAAGEALQRMVDVTPRDNDMTARWLAPRQLAIPELLHALRITPSRERVALRIEKDGSTRDVELEAGPFRDFDPPQKNFSYEYLAHAKALVVKFNTVNWQRDETGATSPAGFFQKVFEFADTHPVDKFIVDVRHNTGGNNMLLLPIVHGFIKRDAINQPEKLFVLIGRQTFSAAQNFVNLMEKHTNARFAGEPTGGRPNHFGDPAVITLPSSKIAVHASTLWWQDVHPADQRPSTQPHLSVDVSSADFFAGRDPVLDAVLRYRPLAKGERARQLQ